MKNGDHYEEDDEDLRDLDLKEVAAIRALETGSIHDEAMEFLIAQRGRLPRVAADIGVSQNTLYDLVAGRRSSLKAVVAEKVLRYKLLLGDNLLSCQLRRPNG
ncbi:MAG TPA: hypothetical protein VMX56_09040 [Anaerolineales bacterium]|nr:hypothetical protein [Anaerolineales bacterium]